MPRTIGDVGVGSALTAAVPTDATAHARKALPQWLAAGTASWGSTRFYGGSTRWQGHLGWYTRLRLRCRDLRAAAGGCHCASVMIRRRAAAVTGPAPCTARSRLTTLVFSAGHAPGWARRAGAFPGQYVPGLHDRVHRRGNQETPAARSRISLAGFLATTLLRQSDSAPTPISGRRRWSRRRAGRCAPAAHLDQCHIAVAVPGQPQHPHALPAQRGGSAGPSGAMPPVRAPPLSAGISPAGACGQMRRWTRAGRAVSKLLGKRLDSVRIPLGNVPGHGNGGSLDR